MAAIIIDQLFFDFKRPWEFKPALAFQAAGYSVNVYPVPLCWKFFKKVEDCR